MKLKITIIANVMCLFLGMAFTACGEGSDDKSLSDGDTSVNVPSADDDSSAKAPEVREVLTCETSSVSGFSATLHGSDVRTLLNVSNSIYQDYVVKDEGVKISNLPFETSEILEDNYNIREYCGLQLSYDNIEVRGLRPENRYYLRSWCLLENRIDETELYLCSNLVSIDTPAESWFKRVSITASSMKDAQIAVILPYNMEPEWNGYNIFGGYEIESLGCQMQTTYRKVSPASEIWPDTDSPLTGIAVDNENSCFNIDLHNLQPGERVRIRPWISVNGERIEAEWQSFTAPTMATEGYVQSGYCMWAACNVGASAPYEIGTEYSTPANIDDAVVPSSDVWQMLMRKTWVCGTLQGVHGWFVMNNKQESPLWTIFLPFTSENEYDGYHFGDYWTSTIFHPSDWGAGSMAQYYFSCDDSHNHYNLQHVDSYVPIGKGKGVYLRLVKYID